jgi:hypothetical protein
MATSNGGSAEEYRTQLTQISQKVRDKIYASVMAADISKPDQAILEIGQFLVAHTGCGNIPQAQADAATNVLKLMLHAVQLRLVAQEGAVETTVHESALLITRKLVSREKELKDLYTGQLQKPQQLNEFINAQEIEQSIEASKKQVVILERT